MDLFTLFEKPIDRPIEGVIKADDDASLYLEIEEYVLTNEVSRRLEDFLAAYANQEGTNGVWISGFFGSGKSHLLKMLALLLENRSINGASVLDLFLPKCGDNAILQADLKRAVAIPSQSILFNIDQKADVISKTEIDALLAVFVKVFDETCGYYGKQGHIARFERDLDSRDLYSNFKQAYREVSGNDWEFGREQALLEAHNIAIAYAQVSDVPEDSVAGILEKYRAEYKVSIEDFAAQINDYINARGPKFRLNFFVDEVGQYIAGNTKLMTNLQTIAESLFTKCRGRAWIVVTAQEDMNTVVGEMDKQQGNDFSKIQARFEMRMKLTSADVAEVIRRRLLQKNDRGVQILSDVYDNQYNNFKTLFDFAEGSQTYRNFRDQDHFIHTYPFIPYQFVLFQSAIQSLSQHNAFEGKHSSVGERSMLGVFQQVAVYIADHEVGQLATFDLMFEGIRAALKSNIQRAILTAEKHLPDPFAVKVLKALFLVKYVKEFKATARNISVLMLSQLDADLPAQREKLDVALKLLETNTYIQRNADQYEYLTDEEKDVEQEIKNTEVDATIIADDLGKIIFDRILKDRKIRDENGQDYAFTKKLDDRLLGREYELGIHVVSPFHEHTGNETILRSQAMGRDELLVIMPTSERLVSDLLMYKRTDKYIRQNISISQRDAVTRILTDKHHQNQGRYNALLELVEELLSDATLIVNGQDLEIENRDPQARIVRGFHELLLRTYPNQRMLPRVTYTESEIATYLQPSSTLFGDDEAITNEAEQEMLSFVQGNAQSGQRTTMQLLVQRFEHKPYGWYLAAIQCTLAKLFARGKIEARQDGNPLEDESLERAIRNTHGYSNVVLLPQIDFTASQVRWLKDFYADFFDGPTAANEAKSLGNETKLAFDRLVQELERLKERSTQYPFLAALDEPIAQLREELTGKSYTYFLTELHQYEDDLFELKEQIFDPIRMFMSGVHKEIYDDASRFLMAQEPNFAHLDGDEDRQLREILEDPICFQGNRMQQAKTLVDRLMAQVDQQVQQEINQAIAEVDERWERFAGMIEFEELDEDQQSALQRPFDELKRNIQRQTLIAVIRDTLHRFNNNEYPQLLRQMDDWKQERTAGGGTTADEEYEIVSQNALRVSFNKALLADEADVDVYLKAVKHTLMEAINNGKRIQI